MTHTSTLLVRAMSLAALFGGVPAWSQVSIGAGSTLTVGDAILSLGCADLNAAGTLMLSNGTLGAARHLGVAPGGFVDAGSGSIGISGDFNQLGTFAPGTSHVASTDGCGSPATTLQGASAFYDFSVATASGRSLIFAPALTQSVAHALSLSGAPGNLLAIRSTSAAQAGLLNLAASGTQTIAYVNVKDNHATGQALAPGTPASFNSVDSGNSNGWFLNALSGSSQTVATPSLSRSAMILFATLIAWLGLRRRRTSP